MFAKLLQLSACQINCGEPQAGLALDGAAPYRMLKTGSCLHQQTPYICWSIISDAVYGRTSKVQKALAANCILAEVVTVCRKVLDQSASLHRKAYCLSAGRVLLCSQASKCGSRP